MGGEIGRAQSGFWESVVSWEHLGGSENVWGGFWGSSGSFAGAQGEAGIGIWGVERFQGVF